MIAKIIDDLRQKAWEMDGTKIKGAESIEMVQVLKTDVQGDIDYVCKYIAFWKWDEPSSFILLPYLSVKTVVYGKVEYCWQTLAMGRHLKIGWDSDGKASEDQMG